MCRKIYRVKIPKCLDIVVQGNKNEIISILRYVIEHSVCDKESKLYIHSLKRGKDGLYDEELIISTRLKEFREDMLYLHDQS